MNDAQHRNATSGPQVSLAYEDGTAILTLANPPVNAINHAIRSGIVDLILKIDVTRAPLGVILVGAGRCFIAGSDLKEFNEPIAAPDLPSVNRALEDFPLPVVAAIHGFALGGGLELALSCDYRVAAPGTLLGLPEVTLGMVPGAGGTQRLPRLIGAIHSINLVSSGARIDAARALEIGLIDAVAQEDLLSSAKALLAASAGVKNQLRNRSVPDEDGGRVADAARVALKRGKSRPNILHALRLIALASDADFDEALVDERKTFQALRMSEDAIALRHLFFAERKAAEVPGLADVSGVKVSHVGVVGGGAMGQGITKAFLNAGMSVCLIERTPSDVDRSISSIQNAIHKRVERQRLTAEAAAAQLACLRGSTDIKELRSSDIVIEAVFEDMDTKKQLLKKMDDALPQNTLFASNTSYLDINEMAAELSADRDVLGLHFFGPADVMPLLEIVRAKRTSHGNLKTALQMARKLGKIPIVAEVAEGFVGNRVYSSYRSRAELLVFDGALPQEVDEAMRAFGMAMGPFEVSDLSGLDIAWAMRKRTVHSRDPNLRYAPIADRLCEAGRFGRKSGKGWYDHTAKLNQPDAEVLRIIEAERARAGITRKSMDASHIQNQLMMAIINEATNVVTDGVAQHVSDIDVAFCNGYGFPRWRGGPVFWAQQQGRDFLMRELAELKQAHGSALRVGSIDELLLQTE